MKNIKLLLLSTALVAAASLGFAQTAPNISTTDATVSGLNTSTGLQNAVSNTYFQNDGETLLVVKGGGVAVTATLLTKATSMSQNGYGSTPLANQTVSIPAGAIIVIGPLPTGRWNNQYGLCEVSFTSVTGVGATALRVPQ